MTDGFVAVFDFDWASMTPFLYGSLILAVGMLIWDTVEVGRNDAANLTNAVFGARILTRRTAVWLAGFGVVLGAAAASPVIDTARKGIFEPGMLDTHEKALAVYTSVYIVDTVLLYGYSAFGMPISTTACLVFELLGASFALGGYEIVHWNKAGLVVSAIVFSIIISGIAGFLIQISFSARQEREIVLGNPTHFIPLCSELYGVLDAAFDFFILTNKLNSDEILELPVGRKIIYYA